jgi:RNA 2',3'-cyclic 3'-phosphodiesterase
MIRRLFVAVPLADDAVSAVIELVDRIRDERAREDPASATARDVRWVRMDGLHLTTRFLGPTEEDGVPPVADAVRRAAAAHEPFELTIDGGGSFPDPRRPRTLWLAVTDGAAELGALAATVDRELVTAGWPVSERPFRAHLTLARSDGIPAGPDVARRLAAAAEGLNLRSPIDRLVLFESITGGGPARYEPLEVVHLRLPGSTPAR